LLQRLIGEMSPRSASLIHYSEDADITLPAHIATQIVRIVREALTNAVKHARASRIDVSLTSAGDFSTLRIADNGGGFDPATAAGPDSGHFGLSNMMERAARMGGQLQVQSQLNTGTTIELNFTSRCESPAKE
jgi:signal transduction histidine kinase